MSYPVVRGRLALERLQFYRFIALKLVSHWPSALSFEVRPLSDQKAALLMRAEKNVEWPSPGCVPSAYTYSSVYEGKDPSATATGSCLRLNDIGPGSFAYASHR